MTFDLVIGLLIGSLVAGLLVGVAWIFSIGKRVRGNAEKRIEMGAHQ
jgi:uncharacterized protein (DUF2062 family)